MDALWAPWRMDYIQGPRTSGCFLCAALAADADRDNLLLYRGATCAVMMNRFPYNNGHLMILPGRHIPDLAALTREERLGLMDLADRSVRVLQEAMRPDGFNLGYNLGRVAGAGLESHLHLHVVPRWSGDVNFMPVLAETKVIPQALTELYDQLRPRFAD